jgi:predicted Zn finger-like uncharacterized protein
VKGFVPYPHSPNTYASDKPVLCPACRSSEIVTTAKSPDADSYWRCTACGEVWNDSRRESDGRGRHARR